MSVDDKYPGIPRPRKAGDSLDGLVALLRHVADVRGNDYLARLCMAEIGVFSGQSTEIFAEHVGKLIAVDAWDDDSLLGNKALTQYPMENVKACFLDRMARFGNKIVVYHGQSLKMADQVIDGSLDLVYIDADHRYEAVRADIMAWGTKVKPGGFVAGHDYNEQNWGPQVSRAVHELLGKPDAVFKDCSWIKRKI